MVADARQKLLEEQRILEHAAREGDRAQSCPHRKDAKHLGNRRRHRHMKVQRASRTLLQCQLLRPIRERIERGQNVHRQPRALRHGVRQDASCPPRRARETLQLDRCLPLVGTAIRDAEQRRRRIEEPPRTRRERCGEPRRRRLHQELPARRQLRRKPRKLRRKARTVAPIEHPEGEPPRLLCCAVAARERHRGKMRETLIAREIGREELPAPRRPIVAPARPVERDAEHACLTAVLREHRRDMRVMMLDAHERQTVPRRARRQMSPREIRRMQISGEHLGLYLKELLILRHRLCVGREHRRIRQIADVLTEERLPAARQTERILQLRTARENALSIGKGQGERRGRIAAAAAQDLLPARPDAHDGVVHAVHDLTVVHENRIRDLRQPLLRLRIPIEDRLAAEIRARHHPEIIRPEQEEMHGRIRQHDTEVRIPGRNTLCRRADRIRAPREEHNRRRRGREEALLLRRQKTERTHRRAAPRHHGECLRLTVLAAAQTRDRRLTACITGEMIAANTLDSEDTALRHHTPRRRERIPRLRRASDEKAIGGAAHGARIGLRVKATVARIVVLALTGGTHREHRHRGQRAVVRNAADDRVARAAVRTVRKGIAVPPIPCRQDLAPTVRTDAEIGRDERRRPRPRRARQDAERPLPAGRDRLPRHRRHQSRTRRIVCERRSKGVECRRRPLRLNADPRAVVQHPAAERVRLGETIDEGTVAHPLHNP